ncbi:cationic amino acid transporter 4-like [Diadema setosum]|uniref:cationic amino acid transporter 4-like n=1 Tax=Diadema setosum TaxID=31175 RepID=UPI003B3A3EB5
MSSTIRQVLSRLVRLKTLPSDDRMLETNLKRSLSTVELIAVGTGNMIGSGLYVLTGVVARDITGPAIIVSYAIAGIVALLAAVCFIEFCSYIPRTGSAYIFTYVVMGEIWAFLIGWNLILEYVISVAAVGKTLSSFIDELCGNAISNFTTEQIMRGRDLDLGFIEPYPDFVGVILVTLLSLFVIGGVSMSARTMTLFLFINITVICIFTIVGLRHADISNWRDYGGFAPYGVSGIVSGAGTLFYSYVGFDSIALSSEETTNPRKSIPAATVTSLLIAAKGGHLIIQGDWYAILPLLLLQLAAVFSFLLIPLHYKAKTSENYFTMKGVPLTPALSIVFDLVLLMKLETAAWIRFVVWVAIGLIVYFSYGYWHSLERGREETTQEDEHENQQASCASYGTLD